MSIRGGFRWVALVCAVIVVPACSSPSAPSSDDIVGQWNLLSVRVAGEAEHVRPSGTSYSIAIDAERVSARADCNTCSGAASLSSPALTIGPVLACTRAACATAAFANAFTTVLSGTHTVAVSDRLLTLSSPRGELRFER